MSRIPDEYTQKIDLDRGVAFLHIPHAIYQVAMTARKSPVTPSRKTYIENSDMHRRNPMR